MDTRIKYQVFVSSTYQDLQEERQEVMHALLELDAIPSGMELFPAANDDQWTLIKGVIDDCDYYILIVGGRYGSIGPDGISYTEMEYRYALSIGKPVIAFLHKNPDSISAGKTERDERGKKLLFEFRQLVEQKMCKYWTDSKDLGSVVSRSLIMLQRTYPGIGWVRADQLPSKDAISEILNLKSQLEKLKIEINALKSQAPEGSDQLSQGEEEFGIRYSFQAMLEGEYSYTTYESTTFKSWNQIFSAISPLMIHEATDVILKQALDGFISHETAKTHAQSKQFKNVSLKNFKLAPNDFQTIKVQLRALGLITKSEKNRSVKDIATYWALTAYGDEIMTRLRAIKKEFLL